MPPPSEEERLTRLLRDARSGDQIAWRKLADLMNQRLRRMVQFRMDPRLSARVDPSDVLQESMLEAWQRLDEFTGGRMPFFVWLRFLTFQRLLAIHRRHFSSEMRDVSREVGRGMQNPSTTSASLARWLVSGGATPSSIAVKSEESDQLLAALDDLEPDEREVLALRHFEHLSNVEAAAVLEMNESTASTKYLRAIRKLKRILERVPGFLDEP